MLAAIERGIALYWRALGRLRGFTPESADRRIDELISAIRAGSVPEGVLVSPLSPPAELTERLRRKGVVATFGHHPSLPRV